MRYRTVLTPNLSHQRPRFGSVRAIEEGEHIIAEIDGGRLMIPSASLDVTLGAQAALPDLYLERIPCA